MLILEQKYLFKDVPGWLVVELVAELIRMEDAEHLVKHLEEKTRGELELSN